MAAKSVKCDWVEDKRDAPELRVTRREVLDGRLVCAPPATPRGAPAYDVAPPPPGGGPPPDARRVVEFAFYPRRRGGDEGGAEKAFRVSVFARAGGGKGGKGGWRLVQATAASSFPRYVQKELEAIDLHFAACPAAVRGACGARPGCRRDPLGDE